MTANLTQDHLSHLLWIAFDLDDTLHYFKRASGRAVEAVFRDVERQFGIGPNELSEAYREILCAMQGSHLDRLLDIYDAALCEALELKPGARQALIAAKRANLSVMVVSEGPHDAQSATIERLGIAPYIDLLVTSAGEGMSKSDGLFEKALERASCDCHEVLYVGDSLARDIVPTSALRIANVYVGEDALPDGSATMRLDLAELSRLLDRDRHCSRDVR